MKSFDVNNIQLEIQSPDMTIDGKLEGHFIQHIEKLGKIYPRINKCELILKIEKDSRNNNCMTEAKLFAPGEVSFTKQKEENFELASTKTFHVLGQQLKKYLKKVKN